MYIPVWLLFFIPGVAAGLASAAPWIIALAVLWGLVCITVRFVTWITDDRSVRPPRCGEPGWLEWAIDKKMAEDATLYKANQAARRMPTSRRALTVSLPVVAPSALHSAPPRPAV